MKKKTKNPISSSIKIKIYNYYKKKAFLADKSIDIENIIKNFKVATILIIIGLLFILTSIIIQPQFQTNEETQNTLLALPSLIKVIGLGISAIGALIFIIYISLPEYYISLRRSLIEKELPFAAVFITLLSGMGLSLTRIFDEVKNIDIFPAFKRELMFVDKIKTFYALTDLDALNFISRFHPSKQLAELYNSFVSVERSGGDKYRTLMERTKTYINLLEDRVSRLIDNFNTLTNIEVIVFVIIPLGLTIVTALTMGGQSDNILRGSMYMATLAFPLLGFVIVNNIIENIYPKELVSLPPSYPFYISFLIIAVLFAIGYINPTLVVAGHKYYIILTLAIIIVTSISGYYYYNWYKANDELIYSLEYIPGYVSDSILKGKTPKQSLIELLKFELPDRVSSLYVAIVSRINLGIKIKDSIRGLKLPWLVKYWIYLIDSAERYGSKYEIISIVGESLSRIVLIQRKILNRRLGFIAGTLIAVLALVGGYSIALNTVLPLLSNLGNLSETISGYQSRLPLVQSLTDILNPINEEQMSFILSIGYIGIVFNSFIMALLAGKIVRGSLAAGLCYAPLLMTVVLIGLIIL